MGEFGGNMGFKGSKKSTPFAAQMAAESAARKSMEHGMRQGISRFYVKGPGAGREGGHSRAASGGLGSGPDQRCHAHPPQWLPPAEAASGLGGYKRIHGTLHRTGLPPLPARKRERIEAGREDQALP